MKYIYEKRDLFTLNNNYILAHCISSDFVMGGGIALLFTKRGVKQKLLDTYPKSWNNHGYCLPTFMKNHIVINLVTKEKVYHKPTYETIKESLIDFKIWLLRAYNIGQIKELKVGMPLIGCGLDLLEWTKVESIIKEVFKNTDIEIYICEWP